MPVLDPDHDDLCRNATWSKERTERFDPTDDPVGYARDWLDGYAHRLHECDRQRHFKEATQESYRDMLAWADDPVRDRMSEALPILLDRIRSHPHPPYSPEVLLAEWQRLQDIPTYARLRDGFVDRMSAWLDRVGTYLAIGPVPGASDDLIDRAISSPTPPKLSDDELAQVRAYLKAPLRLSALQADPAERDRRRKLQEVVAYNDELRATPATDSDGAPPALTANQALVIATMARFDGSLLLSTATVEDEMDVRERLSRETIRKTVTRLIELELAERPEGPRSGARLTMKGRRLAPKIAD